MDRQLKKKRWTWKRIAWILGIPTVLTILIIMAFSNRESTYRAEAARLTLGEVVYGDYQDIISIQGTVEPMTTIQIDATEGGVVEEIFAQDGELVERGQALLRLSNASLTLDFMNRETQIVEQINNLRSTRISLDQNKRQVQEQILEISYQLKEQKRQWTMDSMLFEEGAISKVEYESSKANLSYLLDRKALLNERYKTDERYRQSQLNRIDSSVDMMERNLNAIRHNLENLTVKAPISGQLNSFDHEIGQTKSRGEGLGRIDVPEIYQMSAQVDQYYLNRLRLGQTAQVNIGARHYLLQVSKILPTVVNNQFEVNLQYADTTPPNLRRGQNLQLKLELSAKRKCLMIPKGAFYQSSGGNYVYILTEEAAAVKKQVKLGNQNPYYIEIIEGLEEGDRVITSSYDAFGEAERIHITN